MAGTVNAIQDINAVRFRIEVEEVNDLIKIAKNVVEFFDLKWEIQVPFKYSGVYLDVKSSEKSKGKSVFANVILKIISLQTDEVLSTHHIGPEWFCPGPGTQIFNSGRFICILPGLSIWKNGVFFNKKCLLEVDIETGPSQKAINDEWVKMETIHKSCTGSSNEKFRFTVKKPSCFIGLRSPEIMLKGVSWIAAFVKQNNKFKVQLLMTKDSGSCRAIVTCQLISCNAPANSLQSKTTLENRNDIFAVDWATLINPANQFIENNTFVVEIEIEMGNVKGLPAKAKKRPAPAENNLVELECAVCLESIVGKNISSTPCGHMFCTTCVLSAFQKKSVCPMCKRAVRSNQLRATFLPLK